MMQTPIVAAILVAFCSTISNAQQNRDSVDARRRATRAQERFEQVRRHNLPRRLTGRPDRCDALIGRFCQWNSGDDTLEAKEPRTIRRTRIALLASLDSASRRSPSDGWISGQRIRYLLETRDDTAAVRVARECRAAAWWCAALEGLALQQGRNGAAPDSAFARALRTMPAADRCRWTDMTPLLDPSLRKRFGKVGCGKNEDVAERLWWAADPFWSVAGNDRRTEHYARHTMARILEPARIVYDIGWANDLREMIVRYGWARYWTRGDGTVYEPNGGPISGHEATPNYHFVPVSVGADSIPAAAYELAMNESAERYAPVAVRRLFEIDPQIAVFMRGDSALVVAAYDVSKRNELDATRISASVIVARDERSPSYQAVTGGPVAAMSVLVDTRPQMLSLEVVDAENRRAAGWNRSALDLSPLVPGRVTMSDVLLFDPQETEADDVNAVMKSALGSSIVSRGRVGIFWEIYGLQATDSAMPVSLTLTRVSKGAFRRFGESVGLATKSRPLSIRWTQTMARGSVTARSVVLDLSLIPRGKYQLRIDAGKGGRMVGTTWRAIEIK